MLPVQTGELRGRIVDEQNYGSGAFVLILRKHRFGTGGKAGDVGYCAVFRAVKGRKGGTKRGWSQSILFCSGDAVRCWQIVRYRRWRGLIGFGVDLLRQGILVSRAQRASIVDDEQNISN